MGGVVGGALVLGDFDFGGVGPWGKGEGVRSSGEGGGGSGEDGPGRVGVFSLRASKELRVRISRA